MDEFNIWGLLAFIVFAGAFCYLIWRFKFKKEVPQVPPFRTRDERGNDGHGGRDR